MSEENTINSNEPISSKQRGKQSIEFSCPLVVLGCASVAGKMEGEGPLGAYFDVIEQDPMFGGESWEDAESKMMLKTAELAISKAKLTKEDIRYLIGGDLLGQLIATSFGLNTLEVPLIGVYGACSTMGESLAVGAMIVDGGFADKILAITSSHFAGAEKQFRFPLGYGNQRPLAATWTVTGSGAVVLGNRNQCDLSQKTEHLGSKEYIPDAEKEVRVTAVTIGKIVDYGVKDSMNMGACMAPAASKTIAQHLKDFNRLPDYYDKIVTGDLGMIGKDILLELIKQEGYDISANHIDCGIEIFDPEVQDTHSGGSGCGCSAITLCGYLMKMLKEGKWKRILFVPTGALLSTVSFNEGQSVPGIAHAAVLEVFE